MRKKHNTSIPDREEKTTNQGKSLESGIKKPHLSFFLIMNVHNVLDSLSVEWFFSSC